MYIGTIKSTSVSGFMNEWDVQAWSTTITIKQDDLAHKKQDSNQHVYWEIRWYKDGVYIYKYITSQNQEFTVGVLSIKHRINS